MESFNNAQMPVENQASVAPESDKIENPVTGERIRILESSVIKTLRAQESIDPEDVKTLYSQHGMEHRNLVEDEVMFEAAKTGSTSFFRALADFMGEEKTPSDRKNLNTALRQALKNNHAELQEAIRECGGSLKGQYHTYKGVDDIEILNVLTDNGNDNAARTLLGENEDPKIFLKAVTNGTPKTVRFIMDEDRAHDPDGQAPSKAALSGNRDVLELLRHRGIDLSARNNRGETAYSVVTDHLSYEREPLRRNAFQKSLEYLDKIGAAPEPEPEPEEFDIYEHFSPVMS
jgi:hypothetical protein